MNGELEVTREAIVNPRQMSGRIGDDIKWSVRNRLTVELWAYAPLKRITECQRICKASSEQSFTRRMPGSHRIEKERDL
jgi:hypothetical protein